MHIVDYKTGTSMLNDDEAAAAVQTRLLRAGDGRGVAGAEFWYPGVSPGKRKSVAVRRFSMDRMDDVVTEMIRVQEGILAEEWPTIPGEQCERCPVRIVCPEWPEGREAFMTGFAPLARTERGNRVPARAAPGSRRGRFRRPERWHCGSPTS